MTMETVEVLFVFSIIDVLQPSRYTSYSNEYLYGIWRQILREFNMEQLVYIFLQATSENERYLQE